MGGDPPPQLRSHQEVLFEPGVLVLAKKGEFRGRGDSLFTASGVENLTVRGYGATFRMHKRDYQKAPYEKAEGRMGLSLRARRNGPGATSPCPAPRWTPSARLWSTPSFSTAC